MRLAGLIAVALCLAAPASAQRTAAPSPNEPGAGQTAAQEAVRYGRPLGDTGALLTIVLQAAADVPLAERPGDALFSVPVARIGLRGRLGEAAGGRFGYLVQLEGTRSPAVLDALASYHPTAGVRVSAGLFKTPFSREILTSSSRLDVIGRGRAVVPVSPGRQAGVAVDVGMDGSPLLVRAGLFNAPTADGGAGRLMLVGRVAGRTPPAAGRAGRGPSLTVGASGALTTGPGEGPGVVRLGADARLRTGRLLLAAEALLADADSTGGAMDPPSRRRGAFVTAGVDVTARQRAVARIDHFASRSTPGVARDASTILVLGYNVLFAPAASGQANVVVPLAGEPGGTRVRAVLQIAL